jgi:hypothetical protein
VATASPPSGPPAAPGCRLRLPGEAPAMQAEYGYDNGKQATGWTARKLWKLRRNMNEPTKPDPVHGLGDNWMRR